MVTPKTPQTQGAMDSVAQRNTQNAALRSGTRRMSCVSDDPKVRIQGLSYWYAGTPVPGWNLTRRSGPCDHRSFRPGGRREDHPHAPGQPAQRHG